jgi:hypothetical protein
VVGSLDFLVGHRRPASVQGHQDSEGQNAFHPVTKRS